MGRVEKDPYVRIVRASARGVGVRLSAKDCALLAIEHAIFEAAATLCDDEGVDFDALREEGVIRKDAPAGGVL